MIRGRWGSAMSFAVLAAISLAGLLGPSLAVRRRWHLPVVLGPLLAGLVLGPTFLGRLNAHDPTFTFMADVGFVLIMFVAGARVPVRDPSLRTGLRVGAGRAAAVALLAVAVGVALATAFGTGHAALYSVLLASSSAALVLPIVESLGLGGGPVLQMLPQVAIADTACIIALPLAIDPAHAARASLGTIEVLACAGVLFALLRYAERKRIRRRLHRLSEERKFALDLRDLGRHPSFIVLGLALGAGATLVHVAMRVTRQPASIGVLASAQLGVPIAAATVGSQLHVLHPGEPAALILSALVTLAAAVVAGGVVARRRQSG